MELSAVKPVGSESSSPQKQETANDMSFLFSSLLAGLLLNPTPAQNSKSSADTKTLLESGGPEPVAALPSNPAISEVSSLPLDPAISKVSAAPALAEKTVSPPVAAETVILPNQTTVLPPLLEVPPGTQGTKTNLAPAVNIPNELTEPKEKAPVSKTPTNLPPVFTTVATMAQTTPQTAIAAEPVIRPVIEPTALLAKQKLDTKAIPSLKPDTAVLPAEKIMLPTEQVNQVNESQKNLFPPAVKKSFSFLLKNESFFQDQPTQKEQKISNEASPLSVIPVKDFENPVSLEPAPVQETPSPQKIYEQIVQQVKGKFTPELSEITIKLKPEHLGELTLKVSSTDTGSLNAIFNTSDKNVATTIENGFNQLRQEFSNLGLKLDNLTVSVGMGFSGQQQGQHGQQTPSKSPKRETYSEETAFAPLQEEVSGVDYRI